MMEDESIILGGYTEGEWAGANAGGSDFAAVKLSSEGEVIWRWQVSLLGALGLNWGKETAGHTAMLG